MLRRQQQHSDEEYVKPFWKAPWFWLLVALMVAQLPIFGAEQTNVPEGMDDRFYYLAVDSYNDLVDGWVVREVPGDITPEWIDYHYELMISGAEEYTEDEEIIINSLYTMITELETISTLWHNGEIVDHDLFLEAARTAQEKLGLKKDEHEQQF